MAKNYYLKLYFFHKEEASIIIFVKCYDLFVRGLKCRLWLKDNIPGRRSIFQEGAWTAKWVGTRFHLNLLWVSPLLAALWGCRGRRVIKLQIRQSWSKEDAVPQALVPHPESGWGTRCCTIKDQAQIYVGPAKFNFGCFWSILNTHENYISAD